MKAERRAHFVLKALILAIGCWSALWAGGAVLDVREVVTRESQLFRASHPEFRFLPKHQPGSLSLRKTRRTTMEVPGGVGYGYYYTDAALRWTNSTVLDYYIVTPSVAGVAQIAVNY